VRICRNGRPVAELRPIRASRDPFQQDPQLMGAESLEDPTAPLDPEDWPDPD